MLRIHTVAIVVAGYIGVCVCIIVIVHGVAVVAVAIATIHIPIIKSAIVVVGRFIAFKLVR